jgi:ADP-heptose:LPS heptosyltransferase
MIEKMLFAELLGGLGDVVIALPAIHALALSHPQAQMAVLTFEPGAELLRADPLVTHVYSAQRGDATQPDRPRRALAELLAAERFDLVVSDTTYAGIDQLLASTGVHAVTNLWRQPPAGQLIEERFLQILGEEGLIASWAQDTKPRLSLDAVDRMWAAAHFLQPARRALLHPHTGMPIKAWPLEHVLALARALHDDLGLEVVVPEGVGREAELARQIVRGVGRGAMLLPECTVRQLAAAAACLDVAIGPDTGPVRLAAAVGTPTITLFGPTWMGRYGQRTPHANLQGLPECPERQPADFTRQRCWYSGACPLVQADPDAGEAQAEDGVPTAAVRPCSACMADISTGDVLEAAHRMLNRPPTWGRALTEQVIDR